jgi:SAM-dependent methyltransferase
VPENQLSPKIKDYFRRDDAAAVWWNVDNLPRYRAQVKTFVDHVPLVGKRVLDLGCGKGRFSIAAAQAGARQITAVDISPRMIDEARANAETSGVAPAIDFAIGDVEEVAGTDPVDCIVLMEILVHLPDARAVVHRCADRLAPGGYLVTNVDLPGTGAGLHQLVHRLAKRSYNAIPRPVRRVLHQRLGWPEYVTPKRRVATTEETIRILEDNPGTPMSRADDAFRGLSRHEMIDAISDAGLELVALRRERQFGMTIGFMAIAKKTQRAYA